MKNMIITVLCVFITVPVFSANEARICSRDAYEVASQAFESAPLDTTPMVLHKKAFYFLCIQAAQNPACVLGRFKELIHCVQPRRNDEESESIILRNQHVVALHQLLHHVPSNLAAITYQDVLDLSTRKSRRTAFLVIPDNVDINSRERYAGVEAAYKELCEKEKLVTIEEKKDAVHRDKYFILSLPDILQ